MVAPSLAVRPSLGQPSWLALRASAWARSSSPRATARRRLRSRLGQLRAAARRLRGRSVRPGPSRAGVGRGVRPRPDSLRPPTFRGGARFVSWKRKRRVASLPFSWFVGGRGESERGTPGMRGWFVVCGSLALAGVGPVSPLAGAVSFGPPTAAGAAGAAPVALPVPVLPGQPRRSPWPAPSRPSAAPTCAPAQSRALASSPSPAAIGRARPGPATGLEVKLHFHRPSSGPTRRSPRPASRGRRPRPTQTDPGLFR